MKMDRPRPFQSLRRLHRARRTLPSKLYANAKPAGQPCGGKRKPRAFRTRFSSPRSGALAKYHTILPFSRWHCNGDHYPDKPRHRLSAEAAVGIRGYQAAFVELEEVSPLLEAPRAAAASATADVFRCSIIANTHQLHAAKAKAAHLRRRPQDLRDQPPTTMRRSDISLRTNYRRGKC